MGFKVGDRVVIHIPPKDSDHYDDWVSDKSLVEKYDGKTAVITKEDDDWGDTWFTNLGKSMAFYEDELTLAPVTDLVDVDIEIDEVTLEGLRRLGNERGLTVAEVARQIIERAYGPETINKLKEVQMADVATLVNAKLTADDRFAKNEGLEKSPGVLYGSGYSSTDAFVQWLYDQGTNRKDFLKAMRDARKTVAQEEANYMKSVTADKDKEDK